MAWQEKTVTGVVFVIAGIALILGITPGRDWHAKAAGGAIFVTLGVTTLAAEVLTKRGVIKQGFLGPSASVGFGYGIAYLAFGLAMLSRAVGAGLTSNLLYVIGGVAIIVMTLVANKKAKQESQPMTDDITKDLSDSDKLNLILSRLTAIETDVRDVKTRLSAPETDRARD